jgi:predicted component of type VI protein secretion system
MIVLSFELDIRVLFEKVLATLPKERALEVWDLYLKFEQMAGNLNTIKQIEKRRATTYPELGSNSHENKEKRREEKKGEETKKQWLMLNVFIC